MFEFLSFTEPQPLELFSVGHMLRSENRSDAEVFEGLLGDFDAREKLELTNPLETNRLLEELQPVNPFKMGEIVSFKCCPNIDPLKLSFSGISTAMQIEPLPASRAGVRLLDLPIEIRLQIYSFLIPTQNHCRYKVSGRTSPVKPVPPPITGVCHIIREESLEYWYSVTRFPILFSTLSWFHSPMGVSGTPNYDMRGALHRSIYPEIRKLELSIDQCVGPQLRLTKNYLRFAVDLHQHTNSYSVYHSPLIDRKKLEEYWTNLYRFNPSLRDRSADDERYWRTQRTIQLLVDKFDQATAKIMVASGGVGHITFENYQRLTPLPSWRFWGDMVDHPES